MTGYSKGEPTTRRYLLGFFALFSLTSYEITYDLLKHISTEEHGAGIQKDGDNWHCGPCCAAMLMRTCQAKRGIPTCDMATYDRVVGCVECKETGKCTHEAKACPRFDVCTELLKEDVKRTVIAQSPLLGMMLMFITPESARAIRPMLEQIGGADIGPAPQMLAAHMNSMNPHHPNSFEAVKIANTNDIRDELSRDYPVIIEIKVGEQSLGILPEKLPRLHYVMVVGYTDEGGEKFTILDTDQKPAVWTLAEMKKNWYWSVTTPGLVKTFLDKYENTGRWMIRHVEGAAEGTSSSTVVPPVLQYDLD